MWELDHKEGKTPENWWLQIVVLEKTPESLLDSREIQSILRDINPEYSLEGLMLKLRLQYFGHLMQIDDSLEKSLMLGKIEGRWRRGHQRMRYLDGMTNAMNMNLGKLQEMVRNKEALCAAVHRSHREPVKNNGTHQYKDWVLVITGRVPYSKAKCLQLASSDG